MALLGASSRTYKEVPSARVSGRGVSPCLSSTFQPPGEDEMSLLAALHT